MYTAVVDIPETHLVYSRDMYGNPQINQIDVYSVTLTNAADSQIIVNGVVTSLSNGLYQMTYKLSVAGAYNIAIYLQPGGVGQSYQIAQSPFKVVCQITTSDSSKAVLTGLGTTDATAGVVQNFLVTLFDSGNNRLQVGGDTLLVQITNNQNNIETFDQNNGTYIVKYQINTAGSYQLSVAINNDAQNVKTSTITVVPNVATPQSSTLALTSLFTLNSQQTVTTNIFDSFGNRVINQQHVVLRVTGQGQDIYETFTSVTSSQYTATYSIPSGNSTTSNCGYYTLSSFLILQGGLQGSYYTNRWFAGNPYT